MSHTGYQLTRSPAGLLPIARHKTYKARDGSMAERLRLDVEGYGENEIRKFMLEIAGEETANQIKLDNPPAFTNVDGIRGRSVAFARRRITVSFGVRLKVQALTELRHGLQRAIEASTERSTGRLSTPRNWVFRYVRNGRLTPLPLAGSSDIPMGPSDFIVLMPEQVLNSKGHAYATAVNMRLAGSGALSFRRSAKGKVSRRHQSIGFLALAARAAQASPMFAGFTVTAGFTTRHALPGEVTRLGGIRTGFIRVRPRTGRARRTGR